MRELDLLDHIYRASDGFPNHVIIGPGDDTAVLRPPGGDLLVTVDQVADGVHVDLRTTSLERIARKAITRSLSDVAAMAGTPTAAVVAASLPRDFGDQRARDLFDCLRRVATSYDCPLVGGDILIWDHPLLLTVTILAQPTGSPPMTRSGAQVGDCICVTGSLGGSLQTVDGYTHHLDFEPRLNVARHLANDPAFSLHCMIDVSDGLIMDLIRLCQAGGPPALSAELLVDQLPISPAAELAARQDGQPSWRHALGDGEDYELLFTVPSSQAESVLPAVVSDVPITQIGWIKAGDDKSVVTLKMPDGSVQSAQSMGWEHASKPDLA